MADNREPMTALQALVRLEGIVAGGDTEAQHGMADEALIRFMLHHDATSRNVAEAYLAARERAGFWYA